jgi:hypothetical protein
MSNTSTMKTLSQDDLNNILSLIDFHDVEDYEMIQENWGFDIETLRDKVCDLMTQQNAQ